MLLTLLKQIQEPVLKTTSEASASHAALSLRESTKNIQHNKLAVEVEKGPNLIENENKTEDLQQPVYQNPSEMARRTKNNTLNSEQGNLPSNLQNAPQRPHFIKLSNLTQQERIEIIQKGFQLNQEDKISLKKYYETTQEHSLFHHKGYSIKYDTIRKHKLYQQLKK